MESVLISIKAEWCKKIISKEKTVEIRKSKPNIDVPFKCYIYQTKGGGILGEFICSYISKIYDPYLTWLEKLSCVDMNEIARYKGKNNYIFVWNISNLKVYDKPINLSEFGSCLPPQSWCYIERLTDK